MLLPLFSMPTQAVQAHLAQSQVPSITTQCGRVTPASLSAEGTSFATLLCGLSGLSHRSRFSLVPPLLSLPSTSQPDSRACIGCDYIQPPLCVPCCSRGAALLLLLSAAIFRGLMAHTATQKAAAMPKKMASTIDGLRVLNGGAALLIAANANRHYGEGLAVVSMVVSAGRSAAVNADKLSNRAKLTGQHCLANCVRRANLIGPARAGVCVFNAIATKVMCAINAHAANKACAHGQATFAAGTRYLSHSGSARSLPAVTASAWSCLQAGGNSP